ncbi:MAG: FUN14 domain-containing protein [Candidatus Nitrosopolaris sp.]
MVVETAATTISPLITGTGSAIVGYIMGYAIRKILKWILIIAGVIYGIVFIAIQWLSNNGYIQNVKWEKLGNDISQTGQQLATQIGGSIEELDKAVCLHSTNPIP